MERLTNGFTPGDAAPRATNGTRARLDHPVQCLRAGTLIAPLRPFVTPESPAAYSPVEMRIHMETTMRNLEAGLGSWDTERRAKLAFRDLDYGGERRVLEV